MYFKSPIYNELSKKEVIVWSKLHPQIDPSQWASLCRQIGTLSPREFELVVELLNAHSCLKDALKGHIEGKLGIGGSSQSSEVVRQEMPILSIGPSGVGGEYQREVSMGTIGEGKEGSSYSSFFDKIITTLLCKKFFSEI